MTGGVGQPRGGGNGAGGVEKGGGLGSRRGKGGEVRRICKVARAGVSCKTTRAPVISGTQKSTAGIGTEALPPPPYTPPPAAAKRKGEACLGFLPWMDATAKKLLLGERRVFH